MRFSSALTNLQSFWFCQVWINVSDIILIGLRDYQDTKADVILKYTPDEARNLKTYGELPESGELINLLYIIYFYFVTFF